MSRQVSDRLEGQLLAEARTLTILIAVSLVPHMCGLGRKVLIRLCGILSSRPYSRGSRSGEDDCLCVSPFLTASPGRARIWGRQKVKLLFCVPKIQAAGPSVITSLCTAGFCWFLCNVFSLHKPCDDLYSDRE